MKKLIAIVIALIILAMIIGFERIGRGLQFLISDNRTDRVGISEARTEEGLNDLRDDRLPRVWQVRQDAHFPARPSQSPNIVTEQAARSDYDLGGAPIAINVTGDLSPMHYIRSSEIIGSSEITAAEIERLRRATNILGDGLDPHALIFDADALSTSEAPFILYARDGFDLTEQAKLIYDRLLAEDESAKRTAKVEQGGGGQPATRPESK
jgi:hypothetical protein